MEKEYYMIKKNILYEGDYKKAHIEGKVNLIIVMVFII